MTPLVIDPSDEMVLGSSSGTRSSSSSCCFDVGSRIICQLKLLPLTIYAGTFSNSRNMPLGPENP